MNLLLDTHSFLWFVLDDPHLNSFAADVIENTSNTSFLSVASMWEMAIKVSIGKLSFPQPLDAFIPDQMQRNGIRLLPISLSHALHVATLPLLHKDPFDRLIIAQGMLETMAIVSADAVFDGYGVRRVW